LLARGRTGGMGRVAADDVLKLLDLHREILTV
jgi:hypothetical protein